MPLKARFQPNGLRLRPSTSTQYVCWQCRHASMAATTPAASPAQMVQGRAVTRHPTTQPPSYKPPEFRKSQLHRQYQSMLRSTPLLLLFQHNNIKAIEWMGLRRELMTAFRKVDEEQAKSGNHGYIGDSAKLQIVQTGIFASALKVVEFWNPKFDDRSRATKVTHGLSKEAWRAGNSSKPGSDLQTLLSGPLVTLAMPSVSPQHLKAALSILAPSKDIPAPKRRTTPTYHEPAVQLGVQKLMLLGARIEGKTFDLDGAKWVAGIEGGLEGLRAQLVAILQGAGSGITTTLEAAGRNLYVTMEGRKGMLEAAGKEEEEGKKEA